MKNIMIFLVLFSLMIIHSIGSYAQEPMATIRLINGTLQVKKVDSSKWEMGTVGMMVYPGDQLKTGEKSKAFILFTDATQIKMNANSLLTIEGKREERTLAKKLKLSFGEIWGKVTRQESPLQIETPTSVASVKGTEFDLIIMEEDGEIVTWLFVFEGAMELLNELGQLIVTPGNPAEAGQETPPAIIQVEDNQIPNWEDQIEPQWDLQIIPGAQSIDIDQQFNIQINAVSISYGEIDPAYNKLVAISADSPTMNFSLDGGQTWEPSPTFYLIDGERNIMAKDTEAGSPLIGAAAEDTSPGFINVSVGGATEDGFKDEIKIMEIEVVDDEGNVKTVIIKYTEE